MESKLSGAGPPTAEKWAMQDFRSVVYYPVVAVRDGTNPYDYERVMNTYPLDNAGPLSYSPLVIILHAPFALWRYEVAQWVYFAFLILLTVGAAVLVLNIVGVSAELTS